MVNVIIPHYNDYINLENALASLVAQTKKMFIVTVVDDCSPDQNSFDQVINKYKNFLKIRVIKNETNLGPGMARQAGMDVESHCDYFMFLDSDDMLYPRAIEMLYKEAKLNNADLIYSDIYVENPNGKYVLKLGENTTWFHGKIYRREYLEKIGLRFDNIDFKYNEDSYFNLCATLMTKKKYYLKDEITYLWRNNPKSLTRSKGQKDFIYEHNIAYFLSQVRAIQFLLDRNFTPEMGNLGKTINNLYGAYELDYLLYPEHIPQLDAELHQLFSDPRLRPFFKDSTFILTLIQELKQTRQVGEDLFFFQHSFSSFCQYFGLNFLKE